ncbi:MAG: 8-oxo-dGTP diphosphatase [Pseudomonadota bacterium]|jgi:8-oxo-dGTP diphosphatase
MSTPSPSAAERIEQIDWAAWQPIDVATLLFVREGGRVLLIEKQRGLGQGLVNAPGGRVDPGETPAEAALREVWEELCVRPHEARWCGEHRFQFRDGYSMWVHVYQSAGAEGVATATPEAIPLWTDEDAIPFERMWADDAFWIPMLLRGERFSGHWIFDGKTMVDHALRVLQPGEPDGDVGVRRPGKSTPA